MGKVESWKPPKTEAMTVRFSAEFKKRVVDTCKRHQLTEAEVLRYLLEAGASILDEGGIVALMEARERALNSTDSKTERAGAAKKAKQKG